MRRYTNSKGFSLVELLVVVAIIGILAALAVPSYQKYLMKSKITDLKSVLREGQVAIKTYIETTGLKNCVDIPPRTENDVRTANLNTDIITSLGWGPNVAGIGQATQAADGTTNNCYVEAIAVDKKFGNGPLTMSYVSVTDNQGETTWVCYFSSTVQIVRDVLLEGGACRAAAAP